METPSQPPMGMPAHFIIRATAAGEPPAEALRLLIHAILDHQQNKLRDDATILMIEWRREARR